MISWKSIPFLAYALIHFHLLKSQWSFIAQDSASPSITYPLLVIAGGCLVDNVRFTLSALLGLSGSFKWLMYLSYLCHLVLLPFLFLSLSCTLSEYLDGHDWLVTLGRVTTALFFIHGVYEFGHRVFGNLALTDDMGFIRYTLSKQKSSFSLILPVIILSVYSILVAAVIAFTHELWSQLIINVVCFIGQAQTPRLQHWGPLSSNFLEAVFLANLMSYQHNGPKLF